MSKTQVRGMKRVPFFMGERKELRRAQLGAMSFRSTIWRSYPSLLVLCYTNKRCTSVSTVDLAPSDSALCGPLRRGHKNLFEILGQAGFGLFGLLVFR